MQNDPVLFSFSAELFARADFMPNHIILGTQFPECLVPQNLECSLDIFICRRRLLQLLFSQEEVTRGLSRNDHDNIILLRYDPVGDHLLIKAEIRRYNTRGTPLQTSDRLVNPDSLIIWGKRRKGFLLRQTQQGPSSEHQHGLN